MAPSQVEGTTIVSQQAASSDSSPIEQPQIADGILFLIPVTFIFVWSIATTIFLGLPKLVHSNRRRVKTTHQIPCYQCQFFTNNPYLRCAVRPETVLTKDAATCGDFQAQSQPAKKSAVTRSQR